MTLYLSPEQHPAVNSWIPAYAGTGNIKISPAREVPRFRTGRADALRVLLINQMPEKARKATDNQWTRLLANTHHDIHLTIATPKLCKPYLRWSGVKNNKFDGVIISGANLERKTPDQIPTWPIIEDILQRSENDAASVFYVCWAAQVALDNKQSSDDKLFGVHAQELTANPQSIFAKELCTRLAKIDFLAAPVSRYSYIDKDALQEAAPDAEVILNSPVSRVGLACSRDGRRIYSFNHPEYDFFSLGKECDRDLQEGKVIEPPRFYITEELKQKYRLTDGQLLEKDNPATPPWRPLAQATVDHWADHLAKSRPDYWASRLDYSI